MRCWGPGTLLLVLHTAAAAVYRFPPCACGRELTQPSSLRPAAQGHCSHHHAAHCHHCHGLTASLRRLGSPCVARPAASVLAGAVLCSAVSRASCGSGAGYWQTGASAGSTARHPHAALPPRGPTGEYRHRHTVTLCHTVTGLVSRVTCQVSHSTCSDNNSTHACGDCTNQYTNKPNKPIITTSTNIKENARFQYSIVAQNRTDFNSIIYLVI